jgi:hypothetical protein
VRDVSGRRVPEEKPPPEEYLSDFAPADQSGAERGEGRGGRLRPRKKLVWGQPLPVLRQRDFTLPGEILEREETGELAGRTRRSNRRVKK